MADDRPIRPFVPGERPGAHKLTDLVRAVDGARRAIEESQRRDIEPQAINTGHLLISATEAVGYYTAVFLPYQVKTVDATTDITAEAIGTQGEDVVAMNPIEIGGVGRPIDTSSGAVYGFGHLTALSSSDGRRVVTILGTGSGGRGRVTPFKTLSGAVADADTHTWDRTDDAEALKIFLCTRVYYDYSDPDNPVLEYFAREFTFDDMGMLDHVSAEGKVGVELPEDCTAP